MFFLLFFHLPNRKLNTKTLTGKNAGADIKLLANGRTFREFCRMFINQYQLGNGLLAFTNLGTVLFSVVTNTANLIVTSLA